MNIYFAAWLTDVSLGKSLTKKGGNKRLLSYHFLIEQNITEDQLTKYVQIGRVNVRKRK